jgi:hypothetical protein
MVSESAFTSVIQWFSERGFGVQFTAEDDEHGEPFFWADLTRLPPGVVVAPMYG